MIIKKYIVLDVAANMNNIILDNETRQIVNVHSAAIHIENRIGLLPRQAWFYLLYRAFPYLDTERTFRVPLSDLKKAIGYNSKNHKYLRQILLELVSTPIQWNIFDKDKGELWGASSLLADCEIELGSGMVEFSYSSKLQKRFFNPGMYVKLNLLISKQFTSKYTLAIYCLALDYLNVKINYGEKVLMLDELRQFLGLEEHEYKLAGDLHRRIIQKAEEDINKDSDIKLSITPLRTENKKITGFKMAMSIKEEHLKDYTQPSLAGPSGDNIIIDNEPSAKIKRQARDIIFENKSLIDFIAEHKISFTADTIKKRVSELQEKLEDKFEDYLLDLKKYTIAEQQKGRITKSISGFFITLVKSDDMLHTFTHNLDKKSKEIKDFEQEKEKQYNKILSDFFEINERKCIAEFLERNEADLIRMVKKHQGNPLIDRAISQNGGLINKELVKNANVLRTIQEETTKLAGFTMDDFKTWKKEYEANPDNKSVLEKARKSAERAVSQQLSMPIF
jgi:hypothetical protein